MLLNEIPFCKCILVNRNDRNRSSKFIRNIQANLIHRYLGHFYSTVNVMVNVKCAYQKRKSFMSNEYLR